MSDEDTRPSEKGCLTKNSYKAGETSSRRYADPAQRISWGCKAPLCLIITPAELIERLNLPFVRRAWGQPTHRKRRHRRVADRGKDLCSIGAVHDDTVV